MKYLLSVPGVAYLYARDGVTEDLAPQLTGFFGRANPLAFDPGALDFPDDARRFQIGIPTLPVTLAANAGLELVSQLDLKTVEHHVHGLAQRAISTLTAAGVSLLLPADERYRGPQVAIVDNDPMGLARFLNERRIFPARGHLVRLSFHYFTTESDVDTACAAIIDWSTSHP
jgi:selenocysteine lyase/cysteine desulfurase